MPGDKRALQLLAVLAIDTRPFRRLRCAYSYSRLKNASDFPEPLGIWRAGRHFRSA
jgi:hypothetical protein